MAAVAVAAEPLTSSASDGAEVQGDSGTTVDVLAAKAAALFAKPEKPTAWW